MNGRKTVIEVSESFGYLFLVSEKSISQGVKKKIKRIGWSPQLKFFAQLSNEGLLLVLLFTCLHA